MGAMNISFSIDLSDCAQPEGDVLSRGGAVPDKSTSLKIFSAGTAYPGLFRFNPFRVTTKHRINYVNI